MALENNKTDPNLKDLGPITVIPFKNGEVALEWLDNQTWGPITVLQLALGSGRNQTIVPFANDHKGWHPFGGLSADGEIIPPNPQSWLLEPKTTHSLCNLLSSADIPPGAKSTRWKINAETGHHDKNLEKYKEEDLPINTVFLAGTLEMMLIHTSAGNTTPLWRGIDKKWRPCSGITLHRDGSTKPETGWHTGEDGYGSTEIKKRCEVLDSENLEPSTLFLPDPVDLELVNSAISTHPHSLAQLLNNTLQEQAVRHTPNHFLRPITEKEIPHGAIHATDPNGKVFVVGDIHGHIQEFLTGLEKIGFQEGKDRIFITGDLADRGPDSLETMHKILVELPEKGVFSVLGNHDLWAKEYLDWALDGSEKSAKTEETCLMENELAWLVNAHTEAAAGSKETTIKLREIHDSLKSLPLIREFKVDGVPHFICHSAPVTGQDRNLRVLTPAELHEICAGRKQLENPESVFWDRTLAKESIHQFDPVKNKPQAKVWCGHTPIPKPQESPWVINIDTGCGHNSLSGGLTFMNCATREYHTSNPAQFTLAEDVTGTLVINNKGRTVGVLKPNSTVAVTKSGETHHIYTEANVVKRKSEQGALGKDTLVPRPRSAEMLKSINESIRAQILEAAEPENHVVNPQTAELAEAILDDPGLIEQLSADLSKSNFKELAEKLREIGKEQLAAGKQQAKTGIIQISNAGALPKAPRTLRNPILILPTI